MKLNRPWIWYPLVAIELAICADLLTLSFTGVTLFHAGEHHGYTLSRMVIGIVIGIVIGFTLVIENDNSFRKDGA